ncbi:MAG TPA: SDR family oxidoreductase [Planctomycetaceae bacterium]|nr:SDR family oxidoreductase [Planctomycetaceae bacterium]
MIDLTGQVALVTGASRGVGKAVALQLAAAGADIVLNFAKSRSAADDAAGEIADLGRRVAEVQADVSEPDDVAAMLDWIGESFGRLDIVVSGVSMTSPQSALRSSADVFLTSMTSDARSLLLLAQAARPLLAKSGAGKVIAVSRAASSSTQAAVRQLADELLSDGIQVNAVQAAGDDVAGTVLYLASPLCRGVTGQSLVVADAVPLESSL